MDNVCVGGGGEEKGSILCICECHCVPVCVCVCVCVCTHVYLCGRK